mmetsp:Transcript_27888/g.58478  ORF Transcript_27888/g.58478 Transcript_27888/m.58478 type:complete len:221 (+) Transcript_27888:64-726(+)
MRPGRTATDGDTLSRISEGSNEAGSVVSSYFSAISGAVGGGSAGRIGPGDLLKAALRTPAKDKCAVRSSASVPGSNLEDQAAFREIVKAFVEIGVRGRLVEALRGDGRAQPVVFRLSREVDAFEIGPEPGRGHRVALTEVSAVYTGSSERAKELATTMPGLDASCAVVDLADGRCLSLRFPVDRGGSEAQVAEAQVFAHCMQIFVNEVRRESQIEGKGVS